MTSHNVQNIQTSLGIQQTYSATLCSHVNNIYNKLSKLQKHIQHHCLYSHQNSHQSDTVQIDAPEYNPNIAGDNHSKTDEKHEIVSVQGTLEMIPEPSEPEDDNSIALKTTRSNKINKKLIDLTFPPSRYEVFL